MPGSLTSRNSAMGVVPSSGVQQPTGSLSSGRFASNNLPMALSQVLAILYEISHGSSHGHSGVPNRGGLSVVGSPAYSSSMNGVGGSIPGIPPTSAAVGNRSAVPGMGVSPILGNAGPRITSSMGNMVGGGNMGRNISSGGGLAVPGLASRVNLTANSGSGGLGVQGPSRLMSGVLPQAVEIYLQSKNYKLAADGSEDLKDNWDPFENKVSVLVLLFNKTKNSAYRMKIFLLYLDLKVLSGNAEFAMDMHQKEQLHDNAMSMIQSQHYPMGRSTYSLGGTYASHRQQQQQQHAPSVSGGGLSFTPGNSQDLLHLHGSDLFQSSHGAYHSQVQTSGPPSIGLRPLNSPNQVSGIGTYDQLMQQYQHHPQNQFRLHPLSTPNQSYRDQSLKSMQGAQGSPDRFGLLGLLSVIKMSDPDLTSLALGIDLTTLGLNLNSSENLHKTFGSPWSDEPAKGEPEYVVPECYYAKQPPPLHPRYFSKFQAETLFYIFYSMPKDEAQLFAAYELLTSCSCGSLAIVGFSSLVVQQAFSLFTAVGILQLELNFEREHFC
ncbi:putative NOT transcription complex subunit vip2 [Asimina triloba]